MSEATPAAADLGPIHPSHSHTESPVKGRLLLRMGGFLGVVATSLTMLIFLLGCFGLDGLFAKAGLSSVFGLAVAPLVMTVPGLLLSIAGGSRRGVAAIDPNVLAAVFVNIVGLAGALVEIVVWRQWGLFPSPTGGA